MEFYYHKEISKPFPLSQVQPGNLGWKVFLLKPEDNQCQSHRSASRSRNHLLSSQHVSYHRFSVADLSRYEVRVLFQWLAKVAILDPERSSWDSSLLQHHCQNESTKYQLLGLQSSADQWTYLQSQEGWHASIQQFPEFRSCNWNFRKFHKLGSKLVQQVQNSQHRQYLK